MKYKLIVFDMDGVIFTDDNFWSRMHYKYDTVDEGFRLTEKYLKTDVKKLADEVIGKLWKGNSAEGFFELIETAEYNPGARDLFAALKKKGIKTCILTSGPTELARKAQRDLGIDSVYGNEIVIKKNKITGEYKWLSLDYSHKGETFLGICRELYVNPQEAIVVGDNDQDIFKFEKAGFSIAFNSNSEKLKKAADAVIDDNNLMKILEFVK
ncbi:HAD family phosphatase [Candidatus Woesearchaeota archaeon]|nr:HAD family phosphatase [Candidatus Woesearchaeota archaeon]